MKRIKGIYHTLRFMWLGRFGGNIDGGEYYLLRTITIRKDVDVSLSNLTIHKLHDGAAFFVECYSMAALIMLNGVELLCGDDNER